MEEFEMKRKYVLFLLLIGLALLVSACMPAAQSAAKVVCPINLSVLKEGETRDCVVWDGQGLDTDKATRYAVYDALKLDQNQKGVYRASGDDRSVQIFEGLGYHVAPAIYSAIYPVNQRTYETLDQYDWCPDETKLSHSISFKADIDSAKCSSKC